MPNTLSTANIIAKAAVKNRVSSWRLDVLYGVAAIDPRLGTRVSG